MSQLVFGSVPLAQIEVGMSVSYSQTITDADIKAFAGLSGDHNPVHVSETYANESRFGRRIAHGLMSAGFFLGTVRYATPRARVFVRCSGTEI